MPSAASPCLVGVIIGGRLADERLAVVAADVVPLDAVVVVVVEHGQTVLVALAVVRLRVAVAAGEGPVLVGVGPDLAAGHPAERVALLRGRRPDETDACRS